MTHTPPLDLESLPSCSFDRKYASMQKRRTTLLWGQQSPKTPSAMKVSQAVSPRSAKELPILSPVKSGRFRSKGVGRTGVEWLKIKSQDQIKGLSAEQVQCISREGLAALAAGRDAQVEGANLSQFDGKQLQRLDRAQWEIVLPALGRKQLNEVLPLVNREMQDFLIGKMSEEQKKLWFGSLLSASSSRFERRLKAASDTKLSLAYRHHWVKDPAELSSTWSRIAGRKALKEELLSEASGHLLRYLAPALSMDDVKTVCQREYSCEVLARLFDGVDLPVLKELEGELYEAPQAAHPASILAALSSRGSLYSDMSLFRRFIIDAGHLECPTTHVGAFEASSELKVRCESLNAEQWKTALLHQKVSAIDGLRALGYLREEIETRVHAVMTRSEFHRARKRKVISERITQDWRAMQLIASHHQLVEMIGQLTHRIGHLEQQLESLVAPLLVEGEASIPDQSLSE